MRNVSYYHVNSTLTSIDAAYVIISDLTCMTSICGCLVTVLLYLMYPDIRTTARRMLVFLSVANFVQYIGGILQVATYYQSLLLPDERKLLCASAASISVFGHVSSALWTCAVTVYIFLFLSFPPLTTRVYMMWVCCAFCFGLPVLVTVQGRFSDVYGYDVTDILYFDHPSLCWISDRVANTLQWCFITIEGWVIAAYFVCLIFFVVINCCLYCKSLKKKKNMSPVSSSEDMMEQLAIQAAARQLRFVPFIYCMLRVWGTAHFLFTEYPTKRHLRAFDWLMIIRALGDNLQGLANCLLFCFTTPKIRQMVVNRVRRLCACCGTWCQRQQRRLAEEKWMPRPIVRLRRSVRTRRSVDGSDLDISGISLELPLGGSEDFAEEMEETKYEDDEVLFEQ